MIEMKVAGIALDAITRSPIVLLKDGSDRRALPIYIGQEQARAIMGAMENQRPPRPLTHDLMVNMLEAWNMTLDRVIVMEEVVADASIPVDRDADEAEQEAFREFISNLRPEDLIKRFGNGES